MWSNQIFFSLSQHKLAYVYRKRFSKRIVAEKEINIATTDQEKTGNAWQLALTQLESLLQTLSAPEKTKLHLTLSSDFIRYITLPAQNTFMPHDEKIAYAKAAYREVYGQEVDTWRVQCSDMPPNQTMVAVAINEQLINGIAILADKYQLKLSTITPYLMHVFNQLSAKQGKTDGILAVIEHNRMIIANMQNGICQQIRNQRIKQGWQEQLADTLVREKLLKQNTRNDAVIYAPSQSKVKINSIKGWHIKRLSSATDMHFKESAIA